MPTRGRGIKVTTDKLKLIRCNNLKALIKKTGKSKEVAELIGCKPVYVSQITTGNKVMGDRFAGRVEKSFDMEEGAMSIDPDAMPANVTDMQVYKTAIETVLSLGKEQINALMPLLKTLRKK